MPTYQYACTECDHAFERAQSFSEDSLTVCPECQGRLRKIFNAVGVVFKGSGFYRNDSRADAKTSATNGSSGTNGTSGGSSAPNGDGASTSSSTSSSDGGSSSTSSGSDSKGSASSGSKGSSSGSKAEAGAA